VAVQRKRAFLKPEPKKSIIVHKLDSNAQRKLVKDKDRSAGKNPGVPQKERRESRGEKVKPGFLQMKNGQKYPLYHHFLSNSLLCTPIKSSPVYKNQLLKIQTISNGR